MITSVGVSGCYIAAAVRENESGRVLTLHGNEQSSGIAVDSVKGLGLDDIVEARVGMSDDALVRDLADYAPVDMLYVDGHHQDEPTLAYFRDALPILGVGRDRALRRHHWSLGMKRAWMAAQDA